MAAKTELILRGRKIRVDEDGFISLNDIHTAAGLRKNQKPHDWQRLPSTNPLIIATYERVTGISRKAKIRISDVYKTSPTGTWAHPILAVSYAGYLKPELAVEVNEVWLRHQAGDATLADETLEKSDSAGNEWVAIRALGRVKRDEYTKTLDEHGVSGFGYASCTNAVYNALFDAPAKKLKEQRNLPKSGNLRNAMSTDELVFVMAAETLSKQRIEQENPTGNSACTLATKRSSERIRLAIEDDVKDRQDRLM